MMTKTIQLYEDRSDVTLTTYVLDDSLEMLNGQKRAGILICPGGGYLGYSDREAEPVALRFAAMGYHTFVLRYSTLFGRFHLIDFNNMPASPKSVHPNPVRDIGKAFLTLREHADEWLLDMDSIAICGFSAGGHNCAMYSVYWDKPLITDHFEVEASAMKPAAAILSYPLTDYRLLFDGGRLKDGLQPLHESICIALFESATPSADLVDAVSPVQHVSPNTPPTFIWSTVADTVVPVEHSTRMATALARNGVPFEVHLFEEGVHGLSLANEATAASPIHLDQNAAKWLPLAEAWLKKRFAPTNFTQ